MIEQIDVSTIAEGARLAGVLPYLKDTLQRLEKVVDNRAYSALANGSLTPDKAFQLWVEKNSYASLRKSFETKVRMGVSVAEEHKPELEWRT